MEKILETKRERCNVKKIREERKIKKKREASEILTFIMKEKVEN